MSVPQDWRNAELVPVPKKGDLTKCDNWRGIALLDVIGKLCGRVLQDRLQTLAERELPEYQCGFRSGRGCPDAIYSVRQIVEKTYEHRSKAFCIFVDLRKAYDSVPREALWRALTTLGVPNDLVSIIRSFHDGMEAHVRVAGGLSDVIQVRNGLRQGCVLASVLFSLYLTLGVERWRARLKEMNVDVGVELHYQINGQLFPSSRCRMPSQSVLTDFEYADDAMFPARTCAGAVDDLAVFCEVASAFGLSVNASKTKFMVVGTDVSAEDCADIVINDSKVEHVQSFMYLWSVITPDARSCSDVKHRVAQASSAFGSLRRVFLDRHLLLSTKRHLYAACVVTVLLYGAECWTPPEKDLTSLDRFHHRCIRTVLGVARQRQWDDHLTNCEIRHLWGDVVLPSQKVACRRLEWLGHIARMNDSRWPKQILFGRLQKARPACGPHKRWRDAVACDLKAKGINPWLVLAKDRRQWRECIQLLLQEQPPQPPSLECPDCHRLFRR